MTWDARDLSGRPLGDGLVTRTGTFQKFFTQPELANWVEETLGVRPLAAAPGIFYVFRDPAAAQNFLATRVLTYRPRVTINPQEQYDAHRDTLRPLLVFMRDHARPPRPAELPAEELAAISDAIGGLGRAERLIRLVTDETYWVQVVQQRRSELLVYVALSRFGGRPQFSQLDETLAGDIRAIFGRYRDLCEQSDRLLAVCGESDDDLRQRPGLPRRERDADSPLCSPLRDSSPRAGTPGLRKGALVFSQAPSSKPTWSSCQWPSPKYRFSPTQTSIRIRTRPCAPASLSICGTSPWAGGTTRDQRIRRFFTARRSSSTRITRDVHYMSARPSRRYAPDCTSTPSGSVALRGWQATLEVRRRDLAWASRRPSPTFCWLTPGHAPKELLNCSLASAATALGECLRNKVEHDDFDWLVANVHLLLNVLESTVGVLLEDLDPLFDPECVHDFGVIGDDVWRRSC